VASDVAGDCASGLCGPMVGCHMDQSWATTWTWANNDDPKPNFKNKKRGPPNLATKRKTPTNINSAPSLVKFQSTYMYIFIIITQKGRPASSTPGPPPIQRLNNSICHCWAGGFCCLVRPTFSLNVDSAHRQGEGSQQYGWEHILRCSIEN
jgi:hypothetical protein